MIKPIETQYAGYRFRSRLEARWAVALNTQGIRWEYEAQGFECQTRLSNPNDEAPTFRYLPDFWLPELGLHAEVKASLTEAELVRLLDAAASLSSANGGGCHDGGGHDMVILGPIPEPENPRSPWRLHMHKGVLSLNPWDGWPSLCDERDSFSFAGDYGGTTWSELSAAKQLTAATAADILLDGSRDTRRGYWCGAYRAARAARFEYGESGNPR